jgi:CreA protein
MRSVTSTLLLALALGAVATPTLADDDEVVGRVATAFRLLGPNDHIAILAFDDPKVPGVTCHLSTARRGGLSGAVGLAEDASDSSIACRQVGPVDLTAVARLPREPEVVFTERKSILFKKLAVHRLYDAKRKVLVYLTVSDKLIDGSPKNSISTVPLWRGGQ